MKNIVAVFASLFFMTTVYQVKSQSVYEVKFQGEADVKVLKVQDSASSDLVVYLVDSASLAGTNNGVWYLSGFPDGVMKKIFFVENASDADIKVYYTTNQASAGWVNNGKKSLMN